MKCIINSVSIETFISFFNLGGIIWITRNYIQDFLSVTAALALAACGNKQQSTSSVQAPVEDGFKTEVGNEGTPISGGTLNVARSI